MQFPRSALATSQRARHDLTLSSRSLLQSSNSSIGASATGAAGNSTGTETLASSLFTVTTEEDFLEALDAGASYIQLNGHLSLDKLPPERANNLSATGLPASVKSIRVRADPRMHDAQPARCLRPCKTGFDCDL
jgi:hypothetical protein